MPSRRRFFTAGVSASLTQLPLLTATTVDSSPTGHGQSASLNGEWLFRSGPDGRADGEGWRNVLVPHTWQIEPETTDYMGWAGTAATFEVPASWSESAVRVEFEAVFHSATVWVNGAEVGQHRGKGYTAFTCDIGRQLQLGKANTIVVRADNSFDESMLPRGRSSDWAHDGGIYRPVQLLITPKVYIESIAVDSDPDLTTREATVEIAATLMEHALDTPGTEASAFASSTTRRGSRRSAYRPASPFSSRRARRSPVQAARGKAARSHACGISIIRTCTGWPLELSNGQTLETRSASGRSRPEMAHSS